MKQLKKLTTLLLALSLLLSLAVPAFASQFTDAHGNVIELDDTLEAYTEATLLGADNAARKGETNLGDLWTDALRWFAVEGGIADAYDEDEIAAGNTGIAVDADHVVALWNGGNLRADLSGKFGAAALAEVLPYPNKVAVVYMTGAELTEALEAASQALPFRAQTLDACASFMQVSGLHYTVDLDRSFDAGEGYGSSWFKANSVCRVTITEVNGKPLDPDATYAVITSNANYNGMDSSYIFKQAAAADPRSTITTAVVRDVVWRYIDEVLGNVVTGYDAPAGRITFTGSGFADVSETDWFCDAANFALAAGLMDGTGNNRFTPKMTANRATVLTMLYRMAGSPAVESDQSSWYADARAWAMDTGISDGTRMTDPITRQELAAMLYRCAEQPSADGDLAAFSDADAVAPWATDAVRWAVGAQILQGSSGQLRPTGAASRAEVAAMFMRNLQQ